MTTTRPYTKTQPSEGAGAFAAWLKAARTQKGWSGERLAEEVGSSQGTVSMYERGLRHPHRERAAELAIALGADPRDALEALMADTPGLDSLPEVEREPNEEELQRALMGYSGTDPGLVAAKTTAQSVYDAINRAGAALTGEEPDEVIVRGRKKGITRIDR